MQSSTEHIAAAFSCDTVLMVSSQHAHSPIRKSFKFVRGKTSKGFNACIAGSVIGPISARMTERNRNIYERASGGNPIDVESYLLHEN